MPSSLDFLIMALATYRLSIMLANDWEHGPFGLLRKLREKAGVVHTESGDAVTVPGSFADGLTCEYCNSVWVGLFIVGLYALLALADLPAGLLLSPLALSGASTILVEIVKRVKWYG